MFPSVRVKPGNYATALVATIPSLNCNRAVNYKKRPICEIEALQTENFGRLSTFEVLHYSDDGKFFFDQELYFDEQPPQEAIEEILRSSLSKIREMMAPFEGFEVFADMAVSESHGFVVKNSKFVINGLDNPL